MTPMIDASLISDYLQAAPRLRRAVAGLTADDLLAHPVPGTWSIQQIIVHLVDADLIWTDRAKRVIAEDNPPLIGYDESKFAAALHNELWSLDDAITIFDLNRRNFAKVLQALPPAAFERFGTHNEAGKLRLADMLPRMVRHVDHHLKFVREKRALLGKPLKD
jgi:uncharacterized damage-inducible protein DinB